MAGSTSPSAVKRIGPRLSSARARASPSCAVADHVRLVLAVVDDRHLEQWQLPHGGRTYARPRAGPRTEVPRTAGRARRTCADTRPTGATALRCRIRPPDSLGQGGTTGRPVGAEPTGGTLGRHQRVLIANRGEIAIRIAKAADALGMESVAVYPPVDERSLHTRLATRVPRPIGGARRRRSPPTSTPRRIVGVAIATGCDCVHPGYGFLAENAAFAERCAAAGHHVRRAVAGGARPVRRQGPGPGAGPVARHPGRRRAAPDAGRRRPRTRRGSPATIGYPVMLKAAAGGGGRGMRAVDAARRAGRGVRALPQRGRGGVRRRLAVRRAARRPAPPHRGADPRRRPRQRRPPLRPRLLGAAPQPEGGRGRAGARARPRPARRSSSPTPSRSPRSSGYVNAGTVEFLVAPETGEHFFIECNPRIQVEHTVTEQVTGVDLVEAQFRIAAGESLADLGLADQDGRRRPAGYAVQARVVATGAGDDHRVQGAVGPGRARRRVRLRRLRPAAAVRPAAGQGHRRRRARRSRRRRRRPHPPGASRSSTSPGCRRTWPSCWRSSPTPRSAPATPARRCSPRRPSWPRPTPARPTTAAPLALAASSAGAATADAAGADQRRRRPASRRRSRPATTSTPCAARWAARSSTSASPRATSSRPATACSSSAR